MGRFRLAALAAAVVAAFVVTAVSGGASGVGASAAGNARVDVRHLRVDTEGGLGSQFGGRVDVTVRFRVVNTGDAPVQPTARIRLESQIGGGALSAPFPLETLAPGEHVDITRTAGSLLPFGSAHAVVTVRADDQVTTASAATPVVPWLLLVVVLVVLAVGFALWRASRRRAVDGPAVHDVPRHA